MKGPAHRYVCPCALSRLSIECSKFEHSWEFPKKRSESHERRFRQRVAAAAEVFVSSASRIRIQSSGLERRSCVSQYVMITKTIEPLSKVLLQ